MSTNKHRPHLIVIPEDDANRQLANGFVETLPFARQRQIQVLRPAGGWLSALTLFETEQINQLDRLPDRSVVLLIDFDNAVDTRLARCREVTRERHTHRLFVFGVRSEPEELKQAWPVSTFVQIGAALADECLAASLDKWNHELLAHNAPVCVRLRPILLSLLT